jgi:hypothetical protein
MKTSFLLLLVALLSVTQTNAAGPIALSTPFPVAAGPIPAEKSISSKAISHFQRQYKDATNILWSTEADGYMARSSRAGNINRTFFDRKGNWISNIAYYDGDKLPADVMDIVKSAYHNFTLGSVQQIDIMDKTVYRLDISSGHKVKVLTVCDGELRIVNEFENL